MSEAQSKVEVDDRVSRVALRYALVGALVGFAIWGMRGAGQPASWREAVLIGLLALGSGWVFTEARGKAASSAAFALSLALALGGLAALGLAFGFGLDAPVRERWSQIVLANALIAIIAIAFFRTVFERGLAPTNYPSLFETAWNTHVIGLAAGLFAFIAWGTTAAAASLLVMVGIDGLEDVVSAPIFSLPLWFAAFATAVGVIREQERLVVALRGIVFILIRVIGPILLLAALVFLPLFALKGFAAFDEHTSPAGVLLMVAAVGVIHLNAILGDGADGQRLRPLTGVVARVQGVALAPLLAIAALAVWMRAVEYGLTPGRVVAIVVTGLAAAYAAVYAVLSLLPKGPAAIRSANIALAGIAALVAALIQTPLVLPERLSVNSQLARLASGASNNPIADLAALRVLMGKPGSEALNRLESEARAAGDELRLAQIARARDVESRWDIEGLVVRGVAGAVVQTPRDILTQIVVVSPAGLPIPEDFIDQMDEGRRPFDDPDGPRNGPADRAFDDCVAFPEGRCTVLVLEERGQAKPVIHRFDMLAEDGAIGRLTWRWDGTNWETGAGLAYGPGEPMGEARSAFFDALAEGRVEQTSIAVPALRFGDGTLLAADDLYGAMEPAIGPAQNWIVER